MVLATLWFDSRTTETAAPGTTAAPTVQADKNTAAMATVKEVETAVVVPEEQQSQVTAHQTAEVKAVEAPVTSSESAVIADSKPR